MNMAVDESRSQVLPGGIDFLRMLIDVVGNIAFYSDNLSFVDGYVCLVVFARIDIDERAAEDGHISLSLGRTGIDVLG